MKDNINIVINGMGGQGIVLCGEIIAKTIQNYNHKAFVVQNQNYSAQARGGFSQSTVKISYQPILYPLVDVADILIFTGEEGFKIKSPIDPKGIIIAEEGLEIEKYFPHIQVKYLPLSRTVRQLGNMSQMSVVILGVLQKYLEDFISYLDLTKEISEYFNRNKLQEYIRILDVGRNLFTG